MATACELEETGAPVLRENPIRKTLALAFIVKNEGIYALAMLASVLPIVGFVGWIDTGSTDDSSHRIASYLTQREIPFATQTVPFTRFDEMRNLAAGLIPSHYEWILMLDADEIIAMEDHQKFDALINQENVDAWYLPRYNWKDKIGGCYSETYPDLQGRLFRNKPDRAIRYSGIVHETLTGCSNLKPAGEGDGGSNPPHIHHLKLFTKAESELAERERLYQSLYKVARLEGLARTQRDEVKAKIWGSCEPFADRSSFNGRLDFQGWASDHPYLIRAVDEVRPKVIIEVGVWKGCSVITMADRLRQLPIDGVVIAVDTWLGAWDHWLQEPWFAHLKFEAGYPSLYKTFMANILERGLERYVVPLPLDSLNARCVIEAKGIGADVIHVDGAHDYQSVMSDLKAWWPLLKSGGVMIGNDYHPMGDTWPDVRQAFQDFFSTNEIENSGGKCYIRK